MWLDVFKIAVWLIERYQLQEKIIEHYSQDTGPEERLFHISRDSVLLNLDRNTYTSAELEEEIKQGASL